jgi:hypothetical protein
MIAVSIKSRHGPPRAIETETMKKIIVLLTVLAIAGTIAAYYLYNKPVGSLHSRKADVIIRADSLFSAFESNEADANRKYLNKVILVSGRVQALNSDTGGTTVSLGTTDGMFGVNCRLEDNSLHSGIYDIGREVRLKGLCTGYLMDVVMVRCVPAE